MNNESLGQKILTWGLMIGTGFGAIKLFNAIAPDIIWFLENVWAIVAFGTPLALIGGYILLNPKFVWGIFKTLSAKLTAFIIKMDPLSVMDRYVENLTEKLASLNNTIVILNGKKEKLDRQIASLNNEVQKYADLGKSALKQGNEMQARLYGQNMVSLQGSIKLLTPLSHRVDKNLLLLTSLAENWDMSIRSLKMEIKNKRAEYEIISQTFSGLKSAEDFLGSDSEEARIYGQSLVALEESVTQKYGYISEFERKSKPIMEQMAIEKGAVGEEGLRQLEAMIKGSDLYLPSFDEAIPVKINVQKQKINKFNI